jgi:hypothetical protein
MKLNIDKDKLLKNKFWIMLALAVPMILAAQYIMMVPVAEEIDKQKKKVAMELKKPVNPPFYNSENIQSRLDQAAAITKKEHDWWGKLYAKQAADLFWPTKFEEVYPFADGKFLRELKYLDLGTAGVPDDKHHLSGKLVSRDNNAITVVGKDNKKHRFFRVGKNEMKLDKGVAFFDLQLNKDVEVTFQTGRYFNDKLSDTEQATYLKEYASQIRPLLDIVEPVQEDGNGVVILKDWLVPKTRELPPATVRFLRFVPSPWKADADISEEAWLAQEDLWIQKEIYRLIRQANDYVGKMEGKGVAGLNKTATFKNTYFELGLKLLSADKLQVTIKNLQNRRQKLEVKFRVQLTDDKGGASEPEKITIEGEPLDPMGTNDIKGKPKDSFTQVIDLPPGLNRTGIASVEQALTWDTAAVRRIDHIAIGSLSADEIALNNRAFPDGVKPLIPEPKIEAAAEAEPGGERNAVRPMPFNPGPGGMPGGVNPMVTVNGLIRNRYSEDPTEQTRRIPIAISLIVDQEHVDRVFTSFGNSKFRFVLNQWLINRYPLSVRPNLVVHEKTGPLGFPKGPQGPQGRPRPIGGLPEGAEAGGGEEDSGSNLELVLYGTVTLYNRFPPRELPKADLAAPKQ